MSTIAAGTTSGQALVTTGDTTGNLVLTVNNTTVAFTLNTSGAFGVGTSPSYGTSGQFLTSGGSGAAPAWTTVLPIANGGTNATATPTAGGVSYGTGSAYAFTSAGTSGQVLTSAGSGAPTWSSPTTPGILADPKTQLTYKAVSWGSTIDGFVGVVNLSSTTQLIIVARAATATFYGTVYDSSTDTMGSPVTIATTSANGAISAVKLSATSVLIGYVDGTTFNARVLSISGTTLTANTAATVASVGSSRVMGDPAVLGSTYVFYLGINTAGNNALIAATVSGNTVTLGSATAITAAGATTVIQYRPVVAYSSTTGIVAYKNSDTFTHFVGFSVSGTTITIGADVSSGLVGSAFLSYYTLSSGRILLISAANASGLVGHVVGLSGTTPSVSSSVLGLVGDTTASPNPCYSFSSGNDVLVAAPNTTAKTMDVVVATDSSGTIALSAVTTFTSAATTPVWVLAPASATSIIVADTNSTATSGGIANTITISASAPSVTKTAFALTQYNTSAGSIAPTTINLRGGVSAAYWSLTLSGNSFFYGGIKGTSGRYYDLVGRNLYYSVNTSTAAIPTVLMTMPPLIANNSTVYGYDTTITGGVWYALTSGLYRVQFA